MSAPDIDKQKVLDFKKNAGLVERLGASKTLSMSPEFLKKVKAIQEIEHEKSRSAVLNKLMLEGLKDFV